MSETTDHKNPDPVLVHVVRAHIRPPLVAHSRIAVHGSTCVRATAWRSQSLELDWAAPCRIAIEASCQVEPQCPDGN